MSLRPFRDIKRKIEDILLNLNLDRIYKRGIFSKNRKVVNLTKDIVKKILKSPVEDMTNIHPNPEVGIISFPRLLGNNIAMAATKLGAFTASVLNFISKITGIQRGLEAAETDRIVTAAAATGNEEAQSLLDREKEIQETGFITGSRGTRRKSGTADKERELELDKKIFAARQKITRTTCLNKI